MFIECKIKRPGGTVVDIDGTEYHFKPREDLPTGAHVADVRREDHVARFLPITEAYCICRELLAEAALDDHADEPSGVDDTAKEPPTDEGGAPDEDDATDEDPFASDGASGFVDADPEPDAAPDGHPMDQPQDDDAREAEEKAVEAGFELLRRVLEDTDAASDDDLAAAFKYLKGRKPNARAKRAKIIAAIQDAARESEAQE